MVRALLAFWPRTQWLHQFRNGTCVDSCCSTSASLGKTGSIQDLASCASAVSAPFARNLSASWRRLSQGTSSLTHRPSIEIYKRHVRTQFDCLNSLSIVPLVRNVKMLPLSHTCPTEMVSGHVDTISCAQASRRIARRGKLVTCC